MKAAALTTNPIFYQIIIWNHLYCCALDDELCKIIIPVNLLKLESEYDNVSDGVDTYYNAIMASIMTASATVLPSKKVTSHYEQMNNTTP